MHNITKHIFKNIIIMCKIYIFVLLFNRNECYFYITKTWLNSINNCLETFNIRMQCVLYLYTCNFNKMAIPLEYPLNYVFKNTYRIHNYLPYYN